MPGTTTGWMQTQRNVGIEAEVPESHIRSVVKAVTWRVLATMTTSIIVFFLTGRWETALLVGSIEVVVKLIVYYIHERLWQLVPRTSNSWQSLPGTTADDCVNESSFLNVTTT